MNDYINNIPKLVGIDLETTGCSFSDRIVEVALIQYEYGKETLKFVERVNPGIPIPEVVTRIHGISDNDVKDKPAFSQYADKVLNIITDAVILGYNVMFDFNVLSHEMVRCGKGFLDPKKWVFLDPFVIWKKHDPKNLESAYKYFCKKEHNNPHNALSDIVVTLEVFKSQMEIYNDMPSNYMELGTYCYPKDESWVCSSYHFVYNDNGDIVCNFGKNKRVLLTKLVKEQRTFCDWIVCKDFPEDVKALVKKAMNGEVLPKKEIVIE